MPRLITRMTKKLMLLKLATMTTFKLSKNRKRRKKICEKQQPKKPNANRKLHYYVKSSLKRKCGPNRHKKLPTLKQGKRDLQSQKLKLNQLQLKKQPEQQKMQLKVKNFLSQLKKRRKLKSLKIRKKLKNQLN